MLVGLESIGLLQTCTVCDSLSQPGLRGLPFVWRWHVATARCAGIGAEACVCCTCQPGFCGSDPQPVGAPLHLLILADRPRLPALARWVRLQPSQRFHDIIDVHLKLAALLRRVALGTVRLRSQLQQQPPQRRGVLIYRARQRVPAPANSEI